MGGLGAVGRPHAPSSGSEVQSLSDGTSDQRLSCQVIKVDGNTRLPVTAAGLWVWGQCQGASHLCPRRSHVLPATPGRLQELVGTVCDKLRPLLALAKANVAPTCPFVRTPSQLLQGDLPPGSRMHASQSLLPRPACAPAGVLPSGQPLAPPAPSWIHSHPRQIGFLICQTGMFLGSLGLTTMTLCLLPGEKRGNQSHQAGESRCSQDLLQVGLGFSLHPTPLQLQGQLCAPGGGRTAEI